MQLFLFHNLVIFDDIDGDMVVDVAENVQIEGIDGTFHLNNIFFPHFIAAGVFDDCHGAVQTVEFQVVVDAHTHSRLNMVQHKALMDSADI